LCSKKAIAELAPQMATTLKEEQRDKHWENTDVPLEDVPPEMKCITSLSQVMPPEPGCIAAIIAREIGPPSSVEEPTVNDSLQEDDSNQALANFLVDVAVIPTTDTSNTGNSAPHSVPKGKVTNSQGEAISHNPPERPPATKRGAQQGQGENICCWRPCTCSRQ